MRSATISELKSELLTLKPAQLAEICTRLARFKKENKELLTYLLFEDEESYRKSVKEEIAELFQTINLDHLYFAKKTLRKILRIVNKYSRYSSSKETEVEFRIFFLQQLKDTGIPLHRNKVIENIRNSQLKKVHQVLAGLHEDLQHDYLKEIPED